MKHQNRLTGYCFAAFTVVVWGSTFISSKVLLEFYTPAQIMLTRFILAYCALWLLRPKRLALTMKQEGVFFLLGTGTGIPLHADTFDFDERVLETGVRFQKRLLELPWVKV